MSVISQNAVIPARPFMRSVGYKSRENLLTCGLSQKRWKVHRGCSERSSGSYPTRPAAPEPEPDAGMRARPATSRGQRPSCSA